MAQAFVVTTGPAHNGITTSNPALRGLERRGLVQADRYSLGLQVDGAHRAIGCAAEHGSDSLLVAGPLARGTFGELMGLPQVTRDAEEVAGIVGEWITAQEVRVRVSPSRAAWSSLPRS